MLNVPSNDDRDEFNDTFRPAFSAAIAGRVLLQMSDQFFLRTGLWLQGKSAHFDINGLYDSGSYELNAYYASVPVTAQFQFNKWIGIFGGYAADFRIGGECKSDAELDSGKEVCELINDPNSIVHNATGGMFIRGNDTFSIEPSLDLPLSEMYDGVWVIAGRVMFFFKF